VLIKRVILDQIEAGDLDVIFRKWRKPTVKQGGQLRTSVGMLNIVGVDKINKSKISADDAKRAGFGTKASLLRELDSRDEGDIYRITLEHGGVDPRIALRENRNLNENPRVRAPDLAAGLGLDKPTFKNDVAKLKGLGLTISFSPGYELSPRGKAYLNTLG
jgi:hypothetical protein